MLLIHFVKIKHKCGNGKSCKSSARKGKQSRVSREGLLPCKDRRDIPRTLDTGNDRQRKLYREKIFVTTAQQYKTSEKEEVNEGNCVS